MLKKYKTFGAYFPNPESLKALNIKHLEIETEENWFLKLDEVWNVVYDCFASFYYDSVFKWPVGQELEYAIKGQFKPLLFTSILNFYKSQLVLVENDLNTLKDYTKRGNVINRVNDSVASSGSTPDKSEKWVTGSDVPQAKGRNQTEINDNSIMRNIFTVIKTSLDIYFTDVVTKFQYMFVDKYFLEPGEIDNSSDNNKWFTLIDEFNDLDTNEFIYENYNNAISQVMDIYVEVKEDNTIDNVFQVYQFQRIANTDINYDNQTRREYGNNLLQLTFIPSQKKFFLQNSVNKIRKIKIYRIGE